MSIDLSLPCRVITLNVTIGPSRAGTTLEGLVAEAIRLKHDSTARLARFFALPEVLIGDVIHSLWNGGWVWMDFDTGKIGLTDRTSEGDLDPSNHPAVRTDRREYLYEPLSRLVFSQTQGRRRPHRDFVEVPADFEGALPLADAAPTDLRAAVQRLIEDEQESAYNSLVLSVLPARQGEEGALRWVHLKAAVSATDGRVQLRAVDSGGRWTTPAVARLSARIADYVVRWPASKFSRQILGHATTSLQRAPSAETLLIRMGDDITTQFKHDKVAAWEDRQSKLRDSALRLHQYLDDVGSMRVQADVLTTEVAVAAALRSIIASALHQVVVVSARLTPWSVQTLTDAGIEQALSLGRQLVLIWGGHPDDTLTAPVQAQLDAWRQRFPEQIIVPASSARTDARLIVADDHTALVGSGDLLSSPDFETASILIQPADSSSHLSAPLLPSPTPAARPRAVLELLAWARNRCPDWLLGQAILTSAELTPRGIDLVPMTEPPKLPELPEDRDASMIPVWRASWSEYHSMLTAYFRTLIKGPAVVEVLLDSEIDEAIAERLTHATWRLAIADDTTRYRPARGPLLDDLEQRSRTSLVFIDCPDPRNGLGGASTVNRLPRSRRIGPARGRVFLADHQVVLGSAALLTTSSGQGTGRRSQVAVRIHSQLLADQTADWMGLPTQSPGPSVSSKPAPRGARDALLLAQGALSAFRERSQLDEYLRQELGGHPEPWSLLDHLVISMKESPITTAAVATVLQRVDLPAEQRTIWSGWMIGHLWERHEFVAAAIICRRLLDGPQAIAPDACLLAAAIERPPLPVDLIHPTVSLAERPDDWPATAAARLAGVCGLLAQYLLGADAFAAECIPLLVDSLPEAWRELAVNAAVIYGETGARLPVAEAARAVAQDTDNLSERARWSVVKEKAEKLLALHNRFEDFVSGSVMYHRITANDGLLSKLHRAASGDEELRRHLLTELPIKIRAYLDDIVLESGKTPIAWSDHRSFLAKVDEVVRLARAAARAQPTPADTLKHPGDVEFVGSLHRLWYGLETSMAELPTPYRHPPQALLNQLRPLTVWRETLS